MYGKTFGENDSVHSHSEESIAMIDVLLKSIEITHVGVNCKHHSTLIRDVTPDSVRFVFQHIRESIEAYRDLCDELEDDKDEISHEYEEKVAQFFNRFLNADLTDETNYRAGEVARLNAELADERERSTQLEQRIKVLTAERDLAKKLAKQKSEELKRKLNEKYGTDIACIELKDKLDRKCKEVGELTKELERTEERIKLIEADRDRYFKYLCETHYIDTDLAHMYPKTMLNDPCNFCGNCRHYAQMGKDDGDFEGICTQHYVKRVDPDDASCEHFKPTYDTRVVIGKPEFPCCDHCNHENCSNCTLCPF